MFTNQRNSNDEYNWETYNSHFYRNDIKELVKDHTAILKDNDYIFQDGKLQKNKDILPLHPNHCLLYETVLQLKPSSVIELGCGGGDHLNNIYTLNSNIHLFGRELSEHQINFLQERHPNMKAEIKQEDVTLPRPAKSPVADIGYTQAVIMHIQTGNGHLVALSNLFSYANKHVILMENWHKHNFKEDIDNLFSKGIIPWDNIFFYYRESEELNIPHLMVVSSDNSLPYPKLTDYRLLEEPVIRQYY